MHRLHLSRNLRSLMFLLAAAGIAALVATLWWANRTGLPDSWREKIETAISKQGAHVTIGSLRYIPLRGVVASEIRVFSDEEHEREISRLESVVFDFDYTKLSRGDLRITRLEFRNAGVTMPVDPDDPSAGEFRAEGVRGTLLMPGDRRFELRDARGNIAGIDIRLAARLIGFRPGGSRPPEDPNSGRRREVLSRILHEIGRWDFDPEQPPRLDVFLEGDVNERSSLRATANFSARGVGKNQHLLDEVGARAEMTGEVLTVTSLRAIDPSGKLEGRLDFDTDARHGRFDLNSTLEIPRLLKAWLDVPPPPEVVIGGRQELSAQGEFRLPADEAPVVHATGRARCESLLFRGVRFDEISSSFSFREGDVFLRDIRIRRPDGQAIGKALIQGPIVRLALSTSLPGRTYLPFFRGQPLEIVINDFSDRIGATYQVEIEGGFDMTDRYSWAYTGRGRVENVSYKGVPVNSAECRFSVNHHELDFFDGTVDFDYRNYPLRAAYDGPVSAVTKVGRIRYNGAEKWVEVEKVEGAVWPAPLVRFFASEVADNLEIYRFRRPPRLTGNGVVDVTPRGRTSLDVGFSCEGGADYKFLGETITAMAPRGHVALRGDRVLVEPLEFQSFDGDVSARFERQKKTLGGEVQWTKVSLKSLSSTYGFQIKGGGEATGRMEFRMKDDDVGTLDGSGLLGLEKAELFSVPMFGPLTKLIGTVLNDRRGGYERAKSAFLHFQIDDGVMSTRDFRTQTKSLSFAGDGQVDFEDLTFEMTMRMNARGLLGLITLPLRPFYGMFQFKGTGSIKNPQWENVMFTAPPEEAKELLEPPPKARVVREPR
ncbi:MAG: hypothetical protein H7A49_02870 [Akkermansiaceae bacterium]|nr:hypothetical protein [Akkermansiaceae bacterium]MCP5542831.1 hypothetical protein [Akkermansiaceae bacterium]MCP5547111.1 hypothetical protein [Akkermansiaceae bacterium]